MSDKTVVLPPLRLDLVYALIALGSPLLWSFMDSWLLYFYLPPAGQGLPRVPAVFYGVVILAARGLNAVLTPPIGYLSDNTRSRWGRRLPYMFCAALPLLVFFVLLWMPPVAGESIWNLAYLGGILIAYNLAYSFLMVPYNALMPELAVIDAHRVRISAWCTGAQLVGAVLAGLAGLIIEAQGYVLAALVYAGAALPLFYLPFLVLRERPSRTVAAAERLSFWRSLALIFRNRPAVFLIATGACYWVATTFVMLAMPYIVTEICRLTVADTVYFYLAALVAALVCYPLVTWLVSRFGKWRVMVGSMLASAIVLPGMLFIGDWLPVPLMAQGVVWLALEAMAMAGILVLTQPFFAEVIDYDETLTGQRREGAYYAAWGVLDQIVNGLAAAALPVLFLLGRSQTDINGPLGVRLVGAVGGGLLLVATFIILRYPLRNWTNPRSSAQSERG